MYNDTVNQVLIKREQVAWGQTMAQIWKEDNVVRSHFTKKIFTRH